MPELYAHLSRQEATALFRANIIGALATRELDRGELKAELRALSAKRFRPPGAKVTRCFSVPTLERWLYAYRHRGLEGLYPRRRKDAGRGRALEPDLKKLLIDIRSEYPTASVPLILRTLELAHVIEPGTVKPQTVRRLFRQAGLPRRSYRTADGNIEAERQRLRWQASHVCALWHADVCHALKIPRDDGKRIPALVHLLLDDHSRYIVRIEVRDTERERDMLEIFANALREHEVAPDQLYTDGGSTYSGGVLPVVCERLGSHLSHPQPRDPQARGKGERLFRTMREQCTNHIRGAKSLHHVYVRLLAWRDQYHRTPHSSLMGRTPQQVWNEGIASLEHQRRTTITEKMLCDAYRIHAGRRIRKDSTLDVDGKVYEVDAAWLAGKRVILQRSYLDPDDICVLFEEQRFPIFPVDPVGNARRRRAPMPKQPTLPAGPTALNPAEVALDHMLNPSTPHKEERR